MEIPGSGKDCGSFRDSVRQADGLRRVWICFQPEHKEEAAALADRLCADGLCTERMERIFASDGSVMEGKGSDAALYSPDGRPQGDGTLVLTDDSALALRLQKRGMVCFGCLAGGGWFEGASLVLEELKDVDARFLGEWYLRVQGLPVTVVAAGPLTLREIAAEDVKELVRIAALPEVRRYVRDGCFSEEWLEAYRAQAYRFYGYGLWSVFFEERVIGCCGFAPWSRERTAGEQGAGRRIFMRRLRWEPETDKTAAPALRREPERDNKTAASALRQEPETDKTAAPAFPAGEPGRAAALHDLFSAREEEASSCLELQYFLDRPYRSRGFGSRMCRAALAYAAERLDAEEIVIVLPPQNRASEALARSLGFAEASAVSSEGK